MSDPAAPRLSRWLIGALVFAALYWAFDLVVLRSGVPHPLDDTWDDGLVALGALLLTWALDLVARDHPRPGAAGVVAGLGYLVRPEFLVAAIVLAAMAAARPTGAPLAARLRAAALLLIGVAACGAWWWWH